MTHQRAMRDETGSNTQRENRPLNGFSGASRRGLTRDVGGAPSLVAFGGLRGFSANEDRLHGRQSRPDRLDRAQTSRRGPSEMQGNLLGQSFSDPISTTPSVARTFSVVKSAPETFKAAAPARIMRGAVGHASASRMGGSFGGTHKLRGLDEWRAKQQGLRASSSACAGPASWDAPKLAHFDAPREKGFSTGLRFGPGGFKRSFAPSHDVSGPANGQKTPDTSFGPVAASPAPLEIEPAKQIRIEEFDADMPISHYNVFDLKMDRYFGSQTQDAKFIWGSIEKALITSIESGLTMDWKIVDTDKETQECFGRLYDKNRELVEFQVSLFRMSGSEPIYMEIRRLDGDYFAHDEFVNILTNALKQSNDEFANLAAFKRDESSSDHEMDLEMDLGGSFDEDESVVSESINDADFEDLPGLGELPMPGLLNSLNGLSRSTTGMSVDSFDGKDGSSENRFGLTAQECVETLTDKEAYRDELREASMTLNGLVNDIPSRSHWVTGPLLTDHDGVQLCHRLVKAIASPGFMDAHTSWHTMQAVFGLVKNDHFRTIILAAKASDVFALTTVVVILQSKWSHGNDLVFPSQSIVNVCDSVLNRVQRLVQRLARQ